MSKAKRLASIVLSIIMLVSSFSISSVVYGAASNDNTAQPCYVNINRTTTSISISGIKATCSASLSAKKSMSLKIKMEIQKKKSAGYTTVKTWTSSTTGTKLVAEESRLINILYSYRLKTTYTAGSETSTIYAYPA